MGIHNLIELILEKAPKSIIKRNIQFYKGSTLGFDTSIV